MGFDPDAYLKEKQGAAFDPDAYLRTKAPAAELPGIPEALARGGAQGVTFNFAPAIEGGAKAAAAKLLGAPAGIGDIYRAERDKAQAEYDAAREAHPIATGIGSVGGAALPIILSGGTAALPATTGKVLLRAAGAGAKYGALSGLGASKADLTKGEFGKASLDSGAGALAGMVAAPVVTGGLMLAQAGARPAGAYLLQLARNKGRNVLQGGSTLANANQKPLSDEVVDYAAQHGAFGLGGTRQRAAEATSDALDDVGVRYRLVLDALKKEGITGPEADRLAQSMAAEGRSVAASNTNPAARAVYDAEANALGAREAAPMGQQGQFTIPRDSQGRLDLETAEGIKRGLQERAKYGAYTETPINEHRREAASMVRQAVEDAIQAQMPQASTKAQLAGAQFVPVKQEYGLAVTGANAAAKSAGKALRNTNSLHKAMAISQGLAEGSPGKIVRSLGIESLLRERGPSTAAYTARVGSKLFDQLARAQALRELAAREAAAGSLGAESARQYLPSGDTK